MSGSAWRWQPNNNNNNNNHQIHQCKNSNYFREISQLTLSTSEWQERVVFERHRRRKKQRTKIECKRVRNNYCWYWGDAMVGSWNGNKITIWCVVSRSQTRELSVARNWINRTCFCGAFNLFSQLFFFSCFAFKFRFHCNYASEQCKRKW